jgi:hypothetical protein
VAHDRPAAGADRFDRHHRLAQRVAGEMRVRRDLRLAVEDQRDIGRGAAHVEGEDGAFVQLARRRGRGRHAGGRA